MTNLPRTLIRCVIVLALLLPLPAQETGLKASANFSIETEIKALETQLDDLLLKSNWQEYASHLADDYSQVGEQIQNKQAVLADLQSGKVKFLYLTPDEMQVRCYGDIAILNLHLSIVARENGRVITTSHRMTKVFLRQEGRWLLVSLTDVPVSH
jgi:ketosteroid isomerase-like protein